MKIDKKLKGFAVKLIIFQRFRMKIDKS